ncbi:MAG: hypothetical protein D6707_05645 [Bacteroidetes bacterium]|nr:MAG: hypothetical protein D6707_05645 [Bacteroidota bacterium]
MENKDAIIDNFLNGLFKKNVFQAYTTMPPELNPIKAMEILKNTKCGPTYTANILGNRVSRDSIDMLISITPRRKYFSFIAHPLHAINYLFKNVM